MTQKNILIVDDDTSLRDALGVAMRAADFNVLERTDGETGLAVALEEKPDLILLDITMPRMNGLQMLQKLRRDPWGKNVPVLLLTNADDPAHVVAGVELKSDEYIIKSQTSLETIVKKVRQHLVGYHH